MYGHGLLPPMSVTQVTEQPDLPGWAYGIHCLMMYLHLADLRVIFENNTLRFTRP